MTYIVRSAALRSHCAPEYGIGGPDYVERRRVKADTSEYMMHSQEVMSSSRVDVVLRPMAERRIR